MNEATQEGLDCENNSFVYRYVVSALFYVSVD
jgi:hypothetical protein